MAEQADETGPDGILQVEAEPVVISDAQGRACLVDGAAHLLQAHDLEIQVEVAGADPHGAEQSLEVLGLVQPLVQPHDDATGQLIGALIPRDDPADDQLRRDRDGGRASP